MTDKDFATLASRSIFYEVLELASKTWICRYCRSESSVITEFCNGCGREDCNHGKGDPIPQNPVPRMGAIGLNIQQKLGLAAD